MPEGIQNRGPHQYRVQIRRNGVYQSRTFPTLREAREWRSITDGKVSGGEQVNTREARNTTLAQACDWMLEGSRAGTNANAKNIKAKLRYWKTTVFANWSIVAIFDWDLIEWRREVLDEDNADDGETVGPDAECGPQSVIHRLNALSKLIQTWSRAHRVPVENPVKAGVRPAKPDGRNRRLQDGEDKRLLDAAAKSPGCWLQPAIVIAIETCIRQSELATLTWGRVRLDAEYPYIDLPKTKNDRPRRVPLSVRAVAAFRTLLPAGDCAILGSVPVIPVETGRGIAHAFRVVVTDIEFPGLRWHDLRHEGFHGYSNSRTSATTRSWRSPAISHRLCLRATHI